MNKYLPFVFPLAALIIVAFLAYRWFSMQTVGPTPEIGEGVEIENLTPDEQTNIVRGTGDFQQADLEAVPAEDDDTQAEVVEGTIRYEIKDGRVVFSVMADLAQPDQGFYQVWISSGDNQQKAFRLEMNKGGLSGSAALNQSALPFDVTVSQEQTDDQIVERVILRGTVAE